jgi:hypothetical protein
MGLTEEGRRQRNESVKWKREQFEHRKQIDCGIMNSLGEQWDSNVLGSESQKKIRKLGLKNVLKK